MLWIVFIFGWEKWRQGFNLVQVVSMVLQAFGVYWSNTFIRLNKTDSYYKLRTIYTPWPRPRSERERKQNEREKFKYWLSWILICWIFRLASGLRSWALWMTSPGPGLFYVYFVMLLDTGIHLREAAAWIPQHQGGGGYDGAGHHVHSTFPRCPPCATWPRSTCHLVVAWN